MRNEQITAVMTIETMQNEIDFFARTRSRVECFRLHRLPDARSILESVSLISPPQKKGSLRIESSSSDDE